MNFPQNGFPAQLPYHPQAHAMGQGYAPNMPQPGMPMQGGGFPAPMGMGGGFPMQQGAFDPDAALAAQIAAAQVSGDGNYLEPGFYELTIHKSFLNNGQNGQSFIVEAIVRAANPTNPQHAARFQPGVKVSWGCNLTKHKSSAGNVRKFLAAMFGIDISDKGRMDAELTPPTVLHAMKSNPFAGTIVRVNVVHKPTQTPGGVYSAHTWQSTFQKDPTWSPDALPGANQGQPPAAAPQGFTPPQGPASPAPAPFGSPAALPAPSGGFGAPQGWGQAPQAPAIPSAPQAPAFPPSGWQAHPQAPGWFWNPSTNEVVNEPDLRARGV